MSRKMLRSVQTAAVLASLTACLMAGEPPKVDGLFPAGVQRGETATVKLIGKPGDAPLQVWCDRPELTAQPTEDPAAITLTATSDAPPGVYWLRLFNAAGAAQLRPFIVGTLREVPEVEPNNAVGSAQSVDAAGVVVNGVLSENADVDMFLVPLSAGQTVVASLDADRTFGSPMDGILQLVSPQGFVVAQNDDDHGIDPQLSFTATADGTYAVRLFAFPKDPNSTIRFASGSTYIYRLTVTTGPFIDRVTPVTNDAIGAYRASGWNIVEPIEFVPQRDGAGFAAVLPAPGTWEFDRLEFVPEFVQAESDPAVERIPLQNPGATWGAIEQPADTDVYALTGTTGVKVSLSVAARALGSPLDAVLKIRNADGTVLDTADDRGGNFDPATVFTPSADGEFQVEISDRFGFGGQRFFYVLTATPERPAFAVEVDQDAYAIEVGTPLEIKLKVVRSGGMQEPVTLAVEGLPEGVTATMTMPEPDASGAWIVPNGTDAATLKFEAAEGTTFSGPLSIRGTAGGDMPQRPATAPLIRQPLRTPHLWLTITPKP